MDVHTDDSSATGNGAPLVSPAAANFEETHTRAKRVRQMIRGRIKRGQLHHVDGAPERFESKTGASHGTPIRPLGWTLRPRDDPPPTPCGGVFADSTGLAAVDPMMSVKTIVESTVSRPVAGVSAPTNRRMASSNGPMPSWVHS
jgi:hypothetical protein